MKIDMHVHTVRGSDCSVLTPEELIERAVQIGLDGVCVTEHDHIWRSPDLEAYARRQGLLLFFGVEASTDCGEVLVFGPHEYSEGFHSLSNLRQAVDSVGGTIVVAHPFRESFSPFYSSGNKERPSLEEAIGQPVMELADSLEVLNGASTEEEAEFARSVAHRLGLGMVGGSDAHSIDGVGTCVTVFDRPVSCREEFLVELKEGRYQAKDLRPTLPPPS